MIVAVCATCGATNSGGQFTCLVCGSPIAAAATAPEGSPARASSPATTPVAPPPPTAAPVKTPQPLPSPAPSVAVPHALPHAIPPPVPQLPVRLPEATVVQPGAPVAQPAPSPMAAVEPPVAPTPPPMLVEAPQPALQPVAAASEFHPSHIVPAAGLPTRPRPSSSTPEGPPLPPYLEVEVIALAGEWAQIRCSNEWTAWVDGRYLVPRRF